MIKTKQVLIALAVIGANVLHHMPVRPAYALNYWIGSGNAATTWYGTTTTPVHMYSCHVDANLTLDGTEVYDTIAFTAVDRFYAGYADYLNVLSNTLTITAGNFKADSKIYGGYHEEDNTSTGSMNNKVYIKGGTFYEVYGGYSNYGTAEDNEVNISGGEGKGHIFGGYTDLTGNAERNTVSLCGGSITADVEIAGGHTNGNFSIAGSSSAKYNTVNISGVTMTANVKVHGGHTNGSHLGASIAEYNEVNISGGTLKGEICGGYAANNIACDNTVNIDGGNISSKIYGGKSNDSARYNAVNINSGIISGDVYGGYSTTGTATGNTVNIKGGNMGSVSIYGGYGAHAIENIVNIEGGFFAEKFQLYGGTLSGGGLSTNNTLNLKIAIGSQAEKVADFQKMNFTIPKGATSDMIMLKVNKDNALDLTGIEFTTDLNGLSLAAGDYITLIRGVADGAYGSLPTGYYVIDVAGGATRDLVYYTNGTPAAKGDYTIKQGDKQYNQGWYVSYPDTAPINGNTSSGGLSADSYSGNEIIIRRSKYLCLIRGAYSNTNDVTGNKVNIYDGTFSNSIYGGYTSGTDCQALNNSVNIYGGSFEGTDKEISGGYSVYANAANNTVNFYGGIVTVNHKIYGGLGKAANNNTVNIEGLTITADATIYGGCGTSGNADNNTVNIKSGSIRGKIGGGRAGTGSSATGNTVNIEGGIFTDNFKLYGGEASGTDSANNTLNLKIKMSGKAAEVIYFQNMNFTLPSEIANGDTMLKTDVLKVDYGTGEATINVYAANGVKLKEGDIITLVDVNTTRGGTYTAGNILGGAAELCDEVTLNELINGDSDRLDLVIKLLRDFEQKAPSPSAGGEDQQKAPVEGVAAAAAMVNVSADLASGEGMNSLVAETAGGATDTFGAMSAGSSKYKTGSHVDVDGWGFLVGAGKTKEWKNGTATTYGLFFEYGKGDFDTYNGNVHGDGNSENKGIGIMARHKLTNNTYYEGNIRFGKQETEWSQSELGGYDTDSRYYGISVGVGHIYPVGKNEIDVYGRYTYGHVGACDATLKDSKYHFDSVKSHRVRVGGKYNFKVKDSNAKPYVGLAWEREFKGEARASIAGVGEAPAPSMKGNTGILEVGCDWNVSEKWTLGLGANAYMGKRKGWDGMARVFYNF